MAETCNLHGGRAFPLPNIKLAWAITPIAPYAVLGSI